MMAKFDLTSRLIIGAAMLATMIGSGFYSTQAFSQDPPRVHRVIISDFKFSPEVLQIAVGDTVIWINQDIVPHTATAVNSSWDTGFIGSQEEKSWVVTRAQSLSYYCFYHPGMTATLVISEL